jgi:hypothetical protein
LLAGLLAVLLLAATTLDPVVCPDGCTDDASEHSAAPPASPAACGLCHGWSAPAAIVHLVPVARVLTPLVVAADVERAPFLPRIEHPPKRA